MAGGDSERREVAKVTVRIAPELHRRLRQVLFNRDSSIQKEVEQLIVRFVEHHEQRQGQRRG